MVLSLLFCWLFYIWDGLWNGGFLIIYARFLLHLLWGRPRLRSYRRNAGTYSFNMGNHVYTGRVKTGTHSGR